MFTKVLDHFRIAAPVCFTFVMRKSVDITSVIFVGHLGADYLSAAGLASVTQNVTGNSLIIGLAGALSTLCSQAYGAKDIIGLGLWLQRALLIVWLFVCTPMTILWLFSRLIFEYLGQKSEIARSSSEYLIGLIPGLWAMSISICLQNWLHSQSKTKAIAMITLIVAILHPFICYAFIFILKFHFIGAAFAVSTTKTLELLFLLLYLKFSTVLKETNFTWSTDCYRQWWQFLKLGIPNMMMLSEWWASEMIIFMSGSLNNPEIAVSAMSIYQSINAICFMFPLGFNVSGATIVGNSLGSADAPSARSASLLAPALAFAMTIVMAALLLVTRSLLGRIFTSNPDVNALVFHLVPLLALYIIFDGVQSSLSGILKGMGKQRLGGPIVLFSYYVVGVPLSYYFAFWRSPSWGVFGLCAGTLIGTVVHMLLYFVVVLRTDWPAEVQAVREMHSRQEFLRSPTAKKVLGADALDDEPDLSDIIQEWTSQTDSSRVGLISSVRWLLGLKVTSASEYEMVQQYTDSFADKNFEDDDFEEINRDQL